MKQSKLLKKSLAALLAILMVAAMIPMSAFAADGDAIYVDGIQAVLEDGSYSVTLQYDQENVAAKVGAVEFKLSSLKGTTVTLLDKDGKNPLTASLSGVPGTNSAKRTISLKTTGIDAPATGNYGEYKMVVRIQDAGAEAAQDYPLTIKVEERAKRRNVAIADEDGVTGDNIISYSVTGNVITVVKAIGASKDSMAPVITAADTASTVGNASGKSFTVSNPTAENTSYSKILTDAGTVDAVRVTAEDGSYQDYTIKYETEKVFESITVTGPKGQQQIGDVVYTEPSASDGVVVATFTVPYGTSGDLTPTFKTTKDVDGIVTAADNDTSDANSTTNSGTGGSFFYLDHETVGRRDVSGLVHLDLSDSTKPLKLYASTINQKNHVDVSQEGVDTKDGLEGQTCNLILQAKEKLNTAAEITDVGVANKFGEYNQDLVPVSQTTATQNIVIGDESTSIAEGATHDIEFTVPEHAIVTISNWGDGNEHMIAEKNYSNSAVYNVPLYAGRASATKASFKVDLAGLTGLADTKTYKLKIGTEEITSSALSTGGAVTPTDLAAAFKTATASTNWEIDNTNTTGTVVAVKGRATGAQVAPTEVDVIKGSATDNPGNGAGIATDSRVNSKAARSAGTKVVGFENVPVGKFTRTPLRVVVTSEDRSKVVNYNFTFSAKPTSPATVNNIYVVGNKGTKVTSRTIGGDDVISLNYQETPSSIDVSVSNGATAKTAAATTVSEDHTGKDPIVGSKAIATTGNVIYTTSLTSNEANKGYAAKIIIHAFYGDDASATSSCDPKSVKTFYVKQADADTEELITYAHLTYSTDISNLDMNETNVFDVRTIDHNANYVQVDVPYTFNIKADGTADTNGRILYLYEDEDYTISTDAKLDVDTVTAGDQEPKGLDFTELGTQTPSQAFVTLHEAQITSQSALNDGSFDRTTVTTNIKVTAEDTTKSRTYKVYAVRQTASSACDLNSISSPDEKVSIKLDDVPGTNRYIIEVPYSYNTTSYDRKKTPSFDITFDVSKNATVQDGSTTDPMKFFGPNVTSRSFAVSGGRLYYNGKLVSGDSFVVKAEDGTATKQYLFTVKTLPANTDSTITSITVGDREAVAGENKTFTATVPYGKLRQKLAIVLGSELSKVTINERDYEPDREYDLTNELPITVTAEDGSTSVYKLTVTEAEPSTEAELVSLKVGDKNARINGTDVTAKIGEDADLTKQVLTIEVSEAASYTVAGRVYDNTAIAVNEPVEIVVTAEDGKTTKTYTLTVLAEDVKTENTITGASVDGVEAAIADTAITAEAADPANVTLELTLPEGATAKVGETEYTAGMTVDASSPVTIVVTAEDGTEKTYTLTVTKKGGATLDNVVDVPATHWAAQAIADILDRGIMTTNSKDQFLPNDTVSRGMFAVMMCQLYGVDPADYADAQNPFTDIKKGDWFYNAALAAVDHDWMAGTSKTTFSPKDPVTREQTALIIAKAQGLSKVEAPAEAYSDDARIASWAKGWVYACKDAGLMGYMSTSQKTFNPKGELTRAQMAMILTHINPETDEPETPDEGDTPETPDEGDTPETPDEGDTPETPDEGDTPETPAE